jgi:hypothetical protein
MPNTAKSERAGRSRARELDDEDPLTEVGEEHDFEIDDEIDPADRRLDPLRQPK